VRFLGSLALRKPTFHQRCNEIAVQGPDLSLKLHEIALKYFTERKSVAVKFQPRGRKPPPPAGLCRQEITNDHLTWWVAGRRPTRPERF
jgi:hypothetical protein